MVSVSRSSVVSRFFGTAVSGLLVSAAAHASSSLAGIEPLPLQEHVRPLNFTVEEGTWISVDVTPDGGQLVFDLLGDLYTLPATGGTAQALTRGMPYDSQPRISPDGEWIAFVSDRDGDDNLWVMRRADGALRRLSAVPQGVAIAPSWTPDSQRVLVAETTSYPSAPDGAFRFYSLSGEASDVKDEDGNPVTGSGGVISGDGRYLYFAQRDPDDEARYGMPIAQIRRLDLTRGTLETLTNGMGGGTRPVVSSDGKRLIYATRDEGKTVLRSRDLESGADELLTRLVQQDRQDYGRGLRGDHLPGYSLVDRDQALLLSAGGKIHRVVLHDGMATAVPFRAHVSLEIGPRLHKRHRVGEGPVIARIVQTPAFSPDGRKLAMSILTKLYVMPARAGAKPERLTRGDALEYQPVWSPDGEWIAYVVRSHEGGHIWRVRRDGRDAQRLTIHPAFYTDLAFSADGKRIFAMRGNEHMRIGLREGERIGLPLDLIWIGASGGVANVVAASYRSRHPHFGADARRVYTTDGHALHSIRDDGADPRIHLTLKGRSDNRDNKQPAAERIIVSPDGTQALALINKQVWRITDLQAGNPHITVDAHAPAPRMQRLTDVGADFFGWAQNGRTITWAVGSTVYRLPTERSGDVAALTAGLRESAPGVSSIAVELRVPRAIPKGTLVLHGANVISMTARHGAKMIEESDIVIAGNRITAVGPAGSVAVPGDATAVDLRGKFVVPGFIDTHAHWEFAGPEFQDPDNWSLRANLAYGVTAGLDVQSNHGENFVYQDLVDTGQTTGTRAFMAGPGVFGINNYKMYENDFQSYEETLAYLQRYRRHYRTHNIKAYLAGNRRQRQWIAVASRALGLMPTTEGYGDPLLDITHALDGMHGTEHAMIDSAIFADVVAAFAGTQTSYTPTLNITHYGLPGAEYFFSRVELQDDRKLNRFYPRNRLLELTARRRVWARHSEFSIRAMGQQAAMIQRGGGLVGVGSHGELQGLGYHWEMQMLEMGGMRPAEILRAATLDGARIIGVEQDLGSLEPGKLADLVVLGANPLQAIGNASSIVYVMQNGVLYDGDTLSVVMPGR